MIEKRRSFRGDVRKNGVLQKGVGGALSQTL
jgi:hypothetical protein